MKYLRPLMEKSQSSRSALVIFNRLLRYGIPFNRRHGSRVLNIKPGQVTTLIPYRKCNRNHINGVHACAIATLAEFAAGLVLLESFSPQEYRLIMSTLSAEYHYQAKTDLTAIATIDVATLRLLTQRLQYEEKVKQEVVTEVIDRHNNAIATVTTCWQLKRWDQVRVQL